MSPQAGRPAPLKAEGGTGGGSDNPVLSAGSSDHHHDQPITPEAEAEAWESKVSIGWATYNGFDIILTHIASLASANTGTTAVCAVSRGLHPRNDTGILRADWRTFGGVCVPLGAPGRWPRASPHCTGYRRTAGFVPKQQQAPLWRRRGCKLPCKRANKRGPNWGKNHRC